jgi:pyruvate/2-oxoglutarate dehydrogenase complex dihydrolipoamide dehydrogenase (E3) component
MTKEERSMPRSEQFDVLVLGSGTGGKLVAWHMAQSGRRTAVVESRWVGGSCPNIACMPSKNEIASAKVAHVARSGRHHGTLTGSVTVDMATVRARKREMVDRQIAKHLQIYRTSGAELIMGSGRFLAPKTLEVKLNDGGTRLLSATMCSSTSERTRPCPMFLAWKPPSPSRMSRRWTLTICRNI